jgi:hypothetical protein
MLGNCLDTATADVTTFASTICHKIADTVTPLHADISTLCNCLDALKDGNHLDKTIANGTTLTSTIRTKMAKTVDPLHENITAIEACLRKCLDDIGSHINHITKTLIPNVKNKVYKCMLGTNHGQHAAPSDPAKSVSVPALISTRVPVPVPFELPLDTLPTKPLMTMFQQPQQWLSPRDSKPPKPLMMRVSHLKLP